jgi:flagellar hook-associated protein 2
VASNQMRITGFASGLDTTQIITDLMKAERMPLDKLYQKKEKLQWQRDAYRDVNLELTTLRDKADKLRFSTAFNGFKASSTNTSYATATAKSSAVAGSYDLTINQLAEVARVKSATSITNGGTAVKSTDKVLPSGSADTTISLATTSGTATITVTANDTFDTLAGKMSSAVDDTTKKSLGIRASFDSATSSFVISSKEMGENQKITITDKAASGSINVAALISNGGNATLSDGSNSITSDVTGKNASIKFDGTIINNLTSNKATVYGVELSLLKADPAVTTTIAVESDTESIFNNIKSLVESYNSIFDSLNKKVKETPNRDYAPLTEEQREALTDDEAEKWDEKAKQGLLYNDSILRETLTGFRTSTYKPVAGIPNGQIQLLSQLGIKTGYMSTDGKLEIDEEKLKEAISNNPDEVAKLFTADDGIATRMYDQVNKAIDKLNKKAGRPETAANIDSSTVGNSLVELQKQMDTWEDKLTTIEDRYWKQFTAMETALNKMNEQSSTLASYFA